MTRRNKTINPLREETIELNIPDLLPGVLSEADDCILRLELSLKGYPGIQQIHRVDNTEVPHLCLHYDPTLLSADEIQKIVQESSTKIAKRYRWQILLKGMRAKALHKFIGQLLADHSTVFHHRQVRVVIDVDPVSLL